MNRKLVGFLFILLVLFVSALNYSDTIQRPFIYILDNIKIHYSNSIEYLENSIDKHFEQAKKIEILEEKLEKFEKNYLIIKQLANEVKDIFNENNSKLKSDPRVELVRTISYEKFGNMNRVWLEFNEFNSSKIYGLIYQDVVAGIVVSKQNKPLALLNKDIKSSYAVYIGDKKAPGIAHGNNAKNIIVTFIPMWFNINVGDEVVTSGLDNIFFKGLKVGRVLSISSSQGYQNAVVKPYFKANELNYFHIITKVR